MPIPGKNTSKKPTTWKLRQMKGGECNSALQDFEDSVRLTQCPYFELCPPSKFHRTRFGSRLCFLLQAKKHRTWQAPLIEPFSVPGYHRNTQLVKICVQEQTKSTGSNRNRAKKTTGLKNKAWNTPPIKSIKKSHEISLIRPRTEHKETEHAHLIFLTLLTSSAQKTANLHGVKTMKMRSSLS